MLGQIAGPSFSKVLDKVADAMKDYKLTLEPLEINLRSLSVKALDVEEEVKNGELSGKRKRKREVENWLTEVQKLESEFVELEGDMKSEGFMSRVLGSDRAQKLSGRIEGLVKQSRHFGELLLDVCEPKAVPLLTKRLVGEKFKENLERIWNFLVTNEVRCVGIHGMGGAGKTTLAKHIHNRFLQRTKHSYFWITVSQTFNIKNMQDELARAMHMDISNEHNIDKRAARLNQALSQRKKFVLIFDDVWKNINLENVGDPLTLEGCRLIITTRPLEVCNQIGCQKVVQVKTLDKSDAWNLFNKTLGKDVTLSSKVQEIAQCMAEKCGGLPLGIITTAGSMKGKSDIIEWRNALLDLSESIMREDEEEEEVVYRILKYSFDRLDQGEEKWNGYTKLQHCFLHCSLYPEDHNIFKSELIEQFISEELLDKKRSRRKQVDQGHVVLNKLVNVCLLERNGGCCLKMHDLVRVMALKITKGKYMRIDGKHYSLKEIFNEEEHSAKDIEKIFLMQNGIEDIAIEWSPEFPKFSTLRFAKNFRLKLIPDSFFSNMHHLYVLDLSHTTIKVLPDSISNLRSLRAFLLSQCEDLECVPDLGKLKELRELDLSNTSIKEGPQGMKELVNFECLKIGVQFLKKFLGNLLHNFPNLQCLHLPFCVEAPMNEIETLKHLEEFRGRVKDIHDFNQLMGCQPSFKEYNRSFYVIVAKHYEERLIPGCNEEVIVYGIDFNKERSRKVTIMASDIKHLTFMKCEGLSNSLLDDLQQLNINLRFLKGLRVKYCRGVECILKLEQFFYGKRRIRICI